MSIADKLTTIVENEQKVYEAGKRSEYDRLWDSLQQNGKKTDYEGGFCGVWNDETFKPKYDMRPVNANTMFEHCDITDLKAAVERAGVTLDFSKVSYGRLTQMFQSSQITRVGVIDTTGSANFTINYMFYGAQKLREVEELVITDDGNQQFGATNTFAYCTALKEIRIRGTLGCSLSFQWCPLSRDSIVSIVNALSTTTSGLSVTLSSTAIGNAFTEEEWLALCATKPNWTISMI